jgi:hypothetical protein
MDKPKRKKDVAITFAAGTLICIEATDDIVFALEESGVFHSVEGDAFDRGYNCRMSALWDLGEVVTWIESMNTKDKNQPPPDKATGEEDNDD